MTDGQCPALTENISANITQINTLQEYGNHSCAAKESETSQMRQNGWVRALSVGLTRLVSERRRVRCGLTAMAGDGIDGADSNRWNTGRYLDVVCSTAFDR